MRRLDLHGDTIAKIGVLGAMDLAHAALAQLFNNPLMRDRLADHGEYLQWQLQSERPEVSPSIIRRCARG